MLHASTQKLIIKLCELTEAGHIAWKEADGEICRFETEGYVVEVQGRPATLRLLQSDGRELERADEPDLAAQPWPDGNGTFATQLTLLTARAHRIARGAELAISRILSSLSAPPKAAPFEFASQLATSTEAAPPPAPHTAPGPPPGMIASDTAIERVRAVEAHPAPPLAQPPEPVIIESETTAIVSDPELVDEIGAEAVEETVEPSPAPEPVVIEAETVAIVAEPAPPVPPRAIVQPPPPTPKPVPRPDAFGATTSFAKSRDAMAMLAAPRAASPKPFSTSPLFFGVNQMSHAPVRAEPEPPPVPAPTAKPIPAPPPVAESKSAPAVTGPDIYKPWS
jgi:hypothetical protein